MAEKDNRTTPAIADVDSAADLQADTETAESMNESGIDYMWGSDQDDLIKDQEKGE